MLEYEIWLRPHMPLKEEREKNALYIPLPQFFKDDDRLNYLDRDIYLSLCMKEQLDNGRLFKNITAIVKDIRINPDESEKIFQDYLKKTGKSFNDISDEEIENFPNVPLTIKDVKDSLERLTQFGYIKYKM